MQPGNSNELRQYLQSRHDHYRERGIEYDQAPYYNRVLNEIGSTLLFSGEVEWSDLHEAAGLEDNIEYIFITSEHAMRVHYREGDSPADSYCVLNFDMTDQRGHAYEANKVIKQVWSG